tara:strand:+ start:11788 stop:12366 length:579 start_codon:yes stop_codon:yes gene_type:complete
MKITYQKLSKVKPNPKNPRVIKDAKFKKLLNSIKELPEMLELRPIMLDEDNVVLGGNMRLKALRELGVKEVPTIIYTKKVHIESDQWLIHKKTYEQVCDRLIITDNASFGEWDWDVLANLWESKDLNDWGLDVWQSDMEEFVDDEMVLGMDVDENGDVVINLKMPKYDYEQCARLVEQLLEKHPNIVCRIQN